MNLMSPAGRLPNVHGYRQTEARRSRSRSRTTVTAYGETGHDHGPRVTEDGPRPTKRGRRLAVRAPCSALRMPCSVEVNRLSVPRHRVPSSVTVAVTVTVATGKDGNHVLPKGDPAGELPR
jgi:hypothetical protein